MKTKTINNPAALERHIEQACTQLLELDGWRPLKTDPVSRAEWGRGFGEVGMADHLYIRHTPPRSAALRNASDFVYAAQAEVMWIEFKRIRQGRKAATKTTAKQDDWHAAERSRGALTLIAGNDFPATIEGFIEWYKNSGLMRKNLR